MMPKLRWLALAGIVWWWLHDGGGPAATKRRTCLVRSRADQWLTAEECVQTRYHTHLHQQDSLFDLAVSVWDCAASARPR